MSSKISFSLEENTVLAECVSQHPCLFDLKHPEYKDLQVRENVWKEISSVLTKSVDDCKKRWRNIKDTYNRKKRSRNLGTGSAAKNKPTKWQLADILSFLDVAAYERPSVSNILLNEEDIDEDDHTDAANETEIFNDSMLSEKNVEENEPQPSSLMLEHETTKQKLTADSKTNKKVKRSDALIEVLNKRSQERNKLMEELTKIEDDDPIDAFFKSMALTVKQFSPDLKVKAKLDILRIVSELELKNNHQKDNMPASQVPTRPSTSYEFPKSVHLCPPENRFENSLGIGDYSTSTSLDSEYTDLSGDYWPQSSNN
ncbi:uncharacterized protein LOC126554514 [Aphis gossypii]|uniref:uncharacterized protein LOC126554514 n=1 Tax=Aphis gossypii TaxID=80765 RepID=UPI002158E388|nr:uncharacterized protein LOC126554514 [Aphis gossypii]